MPISLSTLNVKSPVFPSHRHTQSRCSYTAILTLIKCGNLVFLPFFSCYDPKIDFNLSNYGLTTAERAEEVEEEVKKLRSRELQINVKVNGDERKAMIRSDLVALGEQK